jgi:SAM-dependent methyltransferase
MISSYLLHQFRGISQTAFIKITHKRCLGYSAMRTYLEGKAGLEFGGPSSIFTDNNLVPIYNIVACIDNCNFAHQTLWTRNGDHRFGPRAGKQFIIDACEASSLPDECYDFVAASHVLEHVANPLRALTEWKRLLKPSGTILLVLPNKLGTFDHRRPFTTFDHIKADFESSISEEDLTHLEEIVSLHDLKLDPPAGTREQFRQRCLQNASIRAMHHHVFSPQLLVEMFTFLQMRVITLAVERPYHIIIQASKANEGDELTIGMENVSFLSAGQLRKHSPSSVPVQAQVQGSVKQPGSVAGALALWT